MKTSIKRTIRDMKNRRFQFLAIIIVLSIGASMYYGLSMMTDWRKSSLDRTYKELLWEDLQIDLIPNSYVESSVIQKELQKIPEYSYLEAVELRLVETAAINVTMGNSFVIIPAKIIGVNTTFLRPLSNTNTPSVNKIKLMNGNYFKTSEFEKNIAIADKRLFKFYNLSLESGISIFSHSTSYPVKLIGSAILPDYLMLIDENSMGLISEKEFTVLQMPLTSLQKIFSHEKQINQILLRVKDKENLDIVKSAIGKKLESLGIECSIKFGTEHPVYERQYEDLVNDNMLFMLIAILFLISGVFGTYITINRLTVSQQREIGISLALGFKARNIVQHYLGFALIISIVSSLITIILGDIFAVSFWNATKDLLGLPYFITSGQFQPLLEALVIIFIIPFFSVFVAIWHLSNKMPVELIRFDPSTVNSTSSKSLLEKTVFRLIKVSVSIKISIRNLFRNKKRTISTMTGVLLSIILMGSIWGLIDTFDAGINTAKVNVGTWDLKVDSNIFLPSTMWENSLDNLPSSTSINSYLLTLQAPITFPEYQGVGDSELVVFLEGISKDNEVRELSLIEGEFSKNGVVLSKRTAADLNVAVGGRVLVQHVEIGGKYGYHLKNSSIEVTGLHDLIFANFCFMQLEEVQFLFNATNLVNAGYLAIKDLEDESEVIKDLYTNFEAVTRITSRSSLIEETETFFNMFYDIVVITQGFCMVLALALIYNSIYSNINERKREIGTLRTLGTPSRSVLRYLFVENAIMVIFGLLIGLICGYFLIDLLLQQILSETFSHLYVPTVLSIDSWILIISSIFIVLLIAHSTAISFLRKLDLIAATKTRE
ncbi:MAG: ABC transporter permease [Candidatus Hodarchaeota archaeon]